MVNRLTREDEKMKQSIRRIKTAQSRYDKYCGVFSTCKRTMSFREMTPEKLRGMLRMYSKMEADFREHAQKDNSGGHYSNDGVTWRECELTMIDHANSCAKVVSGLRKELQRRSNQGRQRIKS
jgi:hypothetical protein